MRRSFRQDRLGEEIRKIISELLLREIKDPRLSGIVSISAVEVTSDRSYATVYVSCLKSADESLEEQENILSAFRSAKGLIKREIGLQLKLRHTPELIFKADNSMEYGRHITKIIDSLGIKNDQPGEEKNEE